MRTVLYTGIHQKNNGIIAWEYNWENKLFSILFEKSEVQNITYLCKSTDAPYLFAAGEYDGQGMIAVYRIISEGELQFLTSYIYKKGTFSHLQSSKDGRLLFASCYGTGEVLIFSVVAELPKLEMVKSFMFEGSGPNVKRQESSHPHSVYLSPEERLAIVSDLGADRLYMLSIEQKSKTVKFEFEWKATPGCGPRHIAFHPDGKWCYLLTELSSEIYVFTYEESWKNIQKISALPESFVGENLAADILVSKDGKYLYASNRGCNNVSVFKIEQDTGLLHFCKSVSTKGWTRAIELSEKEEIFFALNEEYADSIGELEAFSMNGGMPEQAVSNRRCILFKEWQCELHISPCFAIDQTFSDQTFSVRIKFVGFHMQDCTNLTDFSAVHLSNSPCNHLIFCR